MMFDENSNASSITSPSSVLTSPQTTTTNGIVTQLLNMKDPRWLQLEVCREFQRGQCSRNDLECKFAHPPPHVDVQNGRVTACYDSIKGRCTRENPKCKYLHPPQHLKDQLLITGRNNLVLKNLICSQLNQNAAPPTMSTMNPLAQLVVSGQGGPPAINDSLLIVQQQQQQQAAAAAQAATLLSAPALPYQYYQGITTMYPTVVPIATSDAYQVQLQAQLMALQSLAAMQSTVPLAPSHAAVAAAAAALSATTLPKNRKRTALDDEHIGTVPSPHIDQNSLLLAAAAAAAGAASIPCKRPAADKSGIPIYTNGAAAQFAQIPQPTFNPYLIPGIHGFMPTVSFSGQIPPRF